MNKTTIWRVLRALGSGAAAVSLAGGLVTHVKAIDASEADVPVSATSSAPALTLAQQPTLDQTQAAARRASQVNKVARSASRAREWVLPVANPTLTSTYGQRWGRLHAGLDFAMPVGTALKAMSSGTVLQAGPQGGYGNLLAIRYWDGTMSYYAHMSELRVKVGQKVTPGQVVGLSGNTGHSTGPHLHLEIHPKAGTGAGAAAGQGQLGMGDSFNVRAIDPADPLPFLIHRGLLPKSAAKQ